MIKSNEKVITREAESQQLFKQLEIGYADLFSLEPCDDLYRPLRLKTIVRNAILDIQKAGKLGEALGYVPDNVELVEMRARNLLKEVRTKWSLDDLWEEIAAR